MTDETTVVEPEVGEGTTPEDAEAPENGAGDEPESTEEGEEEVAEDEPTEPALPAG